MTQRATVLLMIGVFSLIGCGGASSGGDSGASAAAAPTIVISANPVSVAPGGTSTITLSGGSGIYQGINASVGSLTPAAGGAGNVYTFTAPATFGATTATITVTDSQRNTGMGGVFLTNGTTSTGGTNTGTTPTVASCGGSYAMNIGGLSATLGVVQNTAGQIGGYLYFPASSVNAQPYTYPIIGTCASGAISFQNISLGQTYSGNYVINGSSISLSGSVQTSAGAVSWSGWAQTVSPAPVAETQACGGTYTANIAGTQGTLTLVHNGGGGVAGYLSLPYQSTTNIYSISGTCGSAISLKNNTNGSTYTGNATFNGASVSMNGTFVTAAGQTYAWSASK